MFQHPLYQQPADERGRDRGHFNQYGMRDDARDPHIVDGENAADGMSAQCFGASGDVQTYGNRVVASADAAVVPPAPTLAVNAGGSSRALGLDYGGERHRGPPLSSRQGAALFNEWADRKR